MRQCRAANVKEIAIVLGPTQVRVGRHAFGAPANPISNHFSGARAASPFFDGLCRQHSAHTTNRRANQPRKVCHWKDPVRPYGRGLSGSTSRTDDLAAFLLLFRIFRRLRPSLHTGKFARRSLLAGSTIICFRMRRRSRQPQCPRRHLAQQTPAVPGSERRSQLLSMTRQPRIVRPDSQHIT